MRLDRGLRSALMRAYPTGYAAAPTDDVNGEAPRCRLGGIKDAGVWLAEKALPSIIELQVRLTPIWVDNETVLARLGENKACLLYPPQSIFSRVRVDALGAGQYQKASGEERIPFMGTRFLDYRLDLPEPCLYQKEFLVQPEGQMIDWALRGREHEEPLPLWAYGAQQIGDDIHPFVFTLECVRDETFITPSSLLFWRERGIIPPQEGWTGGDGAAFQDVFEEDQTRTLVESIEAGMSVIHLELGVDETGDSLKMPYHSFRLSKSCISYRKGGQI